MARSRNIKPGFFKNENLAECSPLARIMFAGLWCEADREGRLEDRPRRLKAEYLPYDDCDADELLGQLAAHGFIVRYAVDGKRFISIPKFGKHQNPHVRECASAIPAPGEHSSSTVQVPGEHGTGHADSSFLIPDSPFLIPEVPTSSGASAPSVDPRDMVFTHGLALLTETGTDETKARKFLGKCVSMHGPDAVSGAVLSAVKNRVGDPIPYLQRMLAGSVAPRASPVTGTRSRSIADDLTDRSWAT